MPSTLVQQPPLSPESTPSPGFSKDASEGPLSQVSTKRSPMPIAKQMSATRVDEVTNISDVASLFSSSAIDGDNGKSTKSSNNNNIVTANDPSGPNAASAGAKKLADEPVAKDQVNSKDTITVTTPKHNSSTSVDDSAVKAPNLNGTDANLINGTATGLTAQVKDTTQKGPQTAIKKHIVHPAPIVTTVPITQMKPPTPTTPVTPTKRPTAPTNRTSPEFKRAKIVPAPSTPSAPPMFSRGTTGSPSPKPLSIERQVAEQRKKLDDLRKKRLQMAKKQKTIDKQMEPFKQRMAEELARLNEEMMAEESAYTEEEQHLSASVEMLAEFKMADGGN